MFKAQIVEQMTLNKESRDYAKAEEKEFVVPHFGPEEGKQAQEQRLTKKEKLISYSERAPGATDV